MTPSILSIDIGGSKILSAIIAGSGEVLARDLQATASLESFEAVLDQIEYAAGHLADDVRGREHRPEAVSIAVAGAIDVEKGVVTVSPNLPQWKDVSLRDLVQQRLGLTTFMVNDASAAALGEYTQGAGIHTRHMVFLTVSTGIGGGIIIEGELYQGACGAAGEIGHMVIDARGPKCGCGNHGCLEVLASGTAIARDATDRISLGTYSSIPQYAGDPGNISAQAVAEAARHGDPLANEVIAQAAHYLGMGLVSIVNIFNPDMVVIGGGVAQVGEMLLGPARSVVQERAFRISANRARIVRGKLGGDAGIVGAAAFAHKSLGARA